MQRIKKILFEIKRFGGFFFRAAQELLTTGWKRRDARYVRYRTHKHIKQNTIIYEAFFGRGLLCGPYALFNEMLSDPTYANYQHIWVLDKLKDHSGTIAEYSRYSNVRFVEYMSKSYIKALATSEYLVNNTTFAAFFIKRPEQIYINTWHGIPIKHLGFDLPNGIEDSSNVIRNLLQVDYLISACPFLTQIYKNSYKLDGIYEGKILEGGYPRLDTLVKSDTNKIKSKLSNIGVKINPDKKIVLYAPTWKAGVNDPDKIILEYSAVKKSIEKAAPDYQVLIKAHQFVSQLLQDRKDIDFIIPATIDANEILPLADILISDYSSIFFDYLYFERPILFYIPDIEEYIDTRGLYIQLDELPGPYTQDLSILASWVSNIEVIEEKYKDKLLLARKENCADRAGDNSSNMLKTIMGENTCISIIDGLSKGKKKILISRGRMRVNGITTSLLSLLHCIDYDTYDVSMSISSSKDALEKQLIQQIDPHVRVLMRKSTFDFRYLDNVRNRIAIAYGLNGIGAKIFPHKAYELEVKRCFGYSNFDYAIDFEGYNIPYAMIIQSVPNAITSIWQHSNMESERTVRLPYLKEVFSIYPYFDRIVSCSKSLMEVNRKNLSLPQNYDSYYYARNTLDYERITSNLKNTDPIIIDGISYCPIVQQTNVMGEAILFVPLDSNIMEDQELDSNTICIRGYTRGNGIIEAQRITEGNSTPYRFITIGRLSPEKNQVALVKAFARFHKLYPMSRLYILGEGPARKSIETAISQNGVKQSVILTGNVSNPFPLLKQCDCFVLPSLHEGQPMVIYEARAFKISIIVSSFASVNDVLLPNGQLVIGTTVDDIYNGLIAYAEGKVPNDYIFDADEYNKEAYHEFLVAIGAE